MAETKTSTALLAPTETALSPHLQAVAQEAHDIIAAGVPANTRRTYRSQWSTFCAWCNLNQREPLPVSGETLILYLTDRSKEVRVSSLQVALAAITVAHREAGHSNWAASDLPGVKIFMRGLARQKGSQPRKKQAMTFELLKAGLPTGDESSAVRDRAILLLGFFSALRRSELSDLDVSDLALIPEGLRISVWGSKTDKSMEGQVISVPRLPEQPDLCPVTAVSKWLELRGIQMINLSRIEPLVPLFVGARAGTRLQPQSIAAIVKSAAMRAGLDPGDFGAHSLRSGFATSAARVDAEERDIMAVTRHTSERTVRGYIQEATLGAHHPGKKIVEKA